MVKLSKLNGSAVMVNALLIEMVETVPDTVITLTTGKKIIVQQSMEEVEERVIYFLRQVGLIPSSLGMHTEGTDAT